MLSLTRMSTLKAHRTTRFPWRRVTPRHSSATVRSLPKVASEAESRTLRGEQLRMEVAPQYKLRHPDHLKQILAQHRTELQKIFDLQESPEVALMFPRSFRFSSVASGPKKEEEKLASAPKVKVKTGSTVAKSKKDEKRKLKERQSKQVAYEARWQHVIASLRSYVDVSVQVGQYELALQAVNYYRWYLKKLHHRLSSCPPEPLPIDIYNLLLSGCATSGDFKVATEVKQLMTWDNINLNASSYAYLLATAKGKGDVFGIIRAMSAANITLDDLFHRTALTDGQLANLLSNIRNCDNNQGFEVPRFLFASNRTCGLVAGLRDARQPFHEERILEADHLRKQAVEQKKRELDGIIVVKSIAAVKKPTDRVVFLRQQVTRCENEWRKELSEIFDRQLETATNQALHLHEMSIYPYLLSLDKTAFVELMVREMRKHALGSESFSLSFSYLAAQLGRKVENLYHIQTKVRRGVLKSQDIVYDEFLNEFNPRHTTPCRELWQSLVTKNSHLAPCIENHRNCPWPTATIVSVGRFLYTILRQLKINVNVLQPNCERRELMNALYSVYRSSSERTMEELKAHKVLSTLYTKAELEDLRFDATQVPMLCPPKPWCHVSNTPFLVSETCLIRVPNESCGQQMNAINAQPVETMYPSLDALNVLSRVPWKVNTPVLEVLTSVFLGDGDSKLGVPKNPSKMVPPDLTALRAKSRVAARNESMMFRREKAETYALWCDMLYKISIAHHFKDDVFFFPHNMDFRGRVYPVPPHFHHLGGDTIRGLLLFGEGRPLGESGLWWLKLHLINLTGSKKRESIEARVRYADEILDDILDSAKNPLTGRKWWQTSDDPWQTLATCKEIANALEAPDPEKYISHLPIHQDGSCNGLQHYAALGRDLEGALQVNLIPKDNPQDVYTGIADVVESRRKFDSENGVEIAQILEGHITRKVVKQTVMTVVYGVTRYGAFHQILGQLESRDGFPQKKASAAAKYLVDKTFASLAEMFTATRLIQNWFTECARSICMATDQPVKWTTPLGLPVVQPYFRKSTQGNLLKSDAMQRSLAVVTPETHPLKQKNGFPPNFVHSLDSAHMMLTAIYCEAAGINFVSVHDCYWTHASTVRIMNKICREQFVALHAQPILENLAEEFQQNYGSLVQGKGKSVRMDDLKKILKKVPSKGEFDLGDVLESTYFFS